MRETVSDSTPESTSSPTIPATCWRSTGTSVVPRASIRSTASRVSAREAGGSGLTMMIHPASGPGGWAGTDLAEPGRGDEPEARAFGLEHGVGGDRRPVHDVAELLGADPGLLADAPHARQHALRRVGGRRRRLHAPLAVVAVVHEEEVV